MSVKSLEKTMKYYEVPSSNCGMSLEEAQYLKNMAFNGDPLEAIYGAYKFGFLRGTRYEYQRIKTREIDSVLRRQPEIRGLFIQLLSIPEEHRSEAVQKVMEILK